jgi:hypothetical protein
MTGQMPTVLDLLQHYQVAAAWLALLLSVISLSLHWYFSWSERRHCLLIFQRYEDIVNRVEQWGDGMTHFVFYVSIINNSLRTPVIILGYDLELQWKDDQFDWLLDPASYDPPLKAYRFPGEEVSYPREEVINDHVYGQGRLAPGDVIEGALLARGYAPIPADYRNGQTISMRFSVIDQDRRRHSTELLFRVSKMPYGRGPLIAHGT